MPRSFFSFSEYSIHQVKALAKMLELEYGIGDPVYKRRPDAAPDPIAYLSKIPEKDLGEIHPDSFAGREGIELATHLSNRQLEIIGTDGTPDLKEALAFSLRSAVRYGIDEDTARQHLSYILNSPAWQ